MTRGQTRARIPASTEVHGATPMLAARIQHALQNTAVPVGFVYASVGTDAP